MSTASELFARPWSSLRTEAWAVRQSCFPPHLAFAVPGARRYETEHYVNTRYGFASISVTGHQCALLCAHCQGRLLSEMIPASTPQALSAIGRRLADQGCTGVLISGGADCGGRVPLVEHLPAIAELTRLGLRVIVHTGLVDRETAQGLRAAGVEQVLFDVVGDAETIHQVLHLDRSPDDYVEALAMLVETGVDVAPHVVVGLHFGQLRGELRALQMVGQFMVATVVLVVLRPLPRTPMADLTGVAPKEVGRLAAVARILNPDSLLTLGCARPAGPAKVQIERYAVQAGVNVLAYPDPSTVTLAREMGLSTSFVESCCTLALRTQPNLPLSDT